MDPEQPITGRIGQVIFTNKARCRDCYRCLRVCPVKAIRMQNGQAYVEAERCIGCGTCIRECPQNAKAYRNDVGEVQRLLASGAPVAVSLAPSFASVWSGWEQRRIPSALRRLGFSHVAETAVGAFFVAQETLRIVQAAPDRPHICSACPAVVNYITHYAPDLVDAITPVVSPMLAHARHIKHMLGAEWKVVFIGPCTAKKHEAAWDDAEAVDAVLTFEELSDWLAANAIDLAGCEESGFDEHPQGDARFFPLPGGLLRTANLTTDFLEQDHIAVSGHGELVQILDSLRHQRRGVIVEPLFCQQGCVSGAGIPHSANAFAGRMEVLRYAAHNEVDPKPENDVSPELLVARFTPQQEATIFSEEDIQADLARTGKANPEDQLNCGACGYSSCREKTIANLSGMAQPDMCIPYMRRLAEQRSDRIIETSPNGIVILDEHLKIIGTNAAFERMFFCNRNVVDKPIAYLMDPAPFERMASGEEEQIEMTARYDNYSIVCHVRLYALREEKQFVGIFVNITKSHEDEEQLKQLRSKTVIQAQELLEHQITMAQKLAQFLGESTAHGEVLVNKLIELTKKDSR